ncbi:MAG: hypothetical protein R3C01_15135 [Planctomycetaceae bacterium]
MRLTLRTLLGYLDDLLEPTQAKEIGEKISESPKAAALVSRIRDVLRRRRIEAPALSGTGSEPNANIVAEYLDNTLSPDMVEELERICLESDVHLAEVGATHQILTLVLGEQVDVSVTLRERMHALGAIANHPTAAGGTATTAPPAPIAASPTKPTPKPEVPEYLRRDSGWKTYFPFMILGVAAIVWVAMVSNDPGRSWKFWEPNQTELASGDTVPAQGEEIVNEAGAGNTAGGTNGPAHQLAPGLRPQNPIVPVEVTPRPAEAPVVPPVDETVAMVKPTDPSEFSIDPPPPSDLPESVVPPGIATGTPTVIPTLPTDPAAPPVAPVPGTIPGTVPVPMPIPDVAVDLQPAWPSVMYTSNEGLLLRHDPAKSWHLLPRRSLLHRGEEIACPEPYSAQVDVGNHVGLLLLGGTRITLVDGPAKGIGLMPDRGRVVISRSDVPAEGPIVMPITLHGDVYQLSLLEPGTLCGLDVAPQPSMAGPMQPQQVSFDGGLYVTAGKVTLANDRGEEVTLTADGGWVQFVGGVPSFQPSSPSSRVNWVSATPPEIPVFTRSINRLFEENFLADKPVGDTIPALLEDRHPRVAELASRLLSLVGNDTGMVRGLSSNHEEARIAAIQGLSVWIRQDPENQKKLEDHVDRNWREDDAAIVLRLVWGFGPFDAVQPMISKDLIDWMGHEDLAIRELAFYHVQRLTNRTYSYRPQNPLVQRNVSLERWKEHLKREGALVAPATATEPTPAAPAPAPRSFP